MSKIDSAKKFAGLIDSHDLAGLQDLLAEDCIAKGDTMEIPKQQFIEYLEALFTAFPDFKFSHNDFREEGEMISFRVEEQGTHTGLLDLTPFGVPLSLPATSKPFKTPETKHTIRVAEGKVSYISEEQVEGGGLAGVLAQLGVSLP
jgi:predicted ester cyclase